jgi:hypothetical protein
MIKRRFEYYIECDGPDQCGEVTREFFMDLTKADCEKSAQEAGWKQATSKKWLCPDCAKKAEERYMKSSHASVAS